MDEGTEKRRSTDDFAALVKSLAGATVAVRMLLLRTEGLPGEENRVDTLRRLEVTLVRAGVATMGFDPVNLPSPVAAVRESSRDLVPAEDFRAEFNALLRNLESLRESATTLLIEDEKSGFEDATPEDPLIRAAFLELKSGLEEILGEAKGQGN